MQSDMTRFEHYKAQILVNFLRKITLTKHTTKAAQEEKDYFDSWTIVAITARITLAPGLRVQSTMAIVARQAQKRDCEAAGQVAQQSGRGTQRMLVLTFSFVFRLEPQPVGWYHACLE